MTSTLCCIYWLMHLFFVRYNSAQEIDKIPDFIKLTTEREKHTC